ncbi:ClpX C4-type zinc finger protein [Streptosporangium sp. NPDC004379]|uniref:ClpX C4-type zinc finger protein n=1 Tax=Streptosporangium sp. NPDC004379 TaxID=3366189 RepID=UPI0036748D1A
MTTPEDLERRFTLLNAVARYDALRIREALAPPPEEDDEPEAASSGLDAPPLTREEALELLALGEVIARKAAQGRQLTVRSARRAGAPWSRIGAALGTTRQAAWEAHNRWIDEQSRQGDDGHWGWSGDEAAAARALAGDPADEEAPGGGASRDDAAACQDSPDGLESRSPVRKTLTKAASEDRMTAPSLADERIHCSFCAKPKSDVDKVVAGPGVYICNECVGLCNIILDTPAEPSEEAEIPWPDRMTDEQILEFLPRVATVSAQVDESLQVWVGRLRDRGVTWARIGAALGMTRQSAWERFSGEE